MEVFTFMATIKDSLEHAMPDALVTVEPHDIDSVSITIQWRVVQRYRARRIVSVKEIVQRKDDIVQYYVALFKRHRADVMAKEGKDNA
jgi:hypothetical protein